MTAPKYETTPENFPDLPGWRFTEREVSACVYRVEGRDLAGNAVSEVGVETEMGAVIEKCRQAALAIERAKQR